MLDLVSCFGETRVQPECSTLVTSRRRDPREFLTALGRQRVWGLYATRGASIEAEAIHAWLGPLFRDSVLSAPMITFEGDSVHSFQSETGALGDRAVLIGDTSFNVTPVVASPPVSIVSLEQFLMPLRVHLGSSLLLEIMENSGDHPGVISAQILFSKQDHAEILATVKAQRALSMVVASEIDGLSYIKLGDVRIEVPASAAQQLAWQLDLDVVSEE